MREIEEKIAKILDEIKTTNATHIRKLKELLTVRSKSQSSFSNSFFKTLTPIFHIQRRVPSAERVIRFISLFATTGNDNAFLEEFLKFLLVAAVAASKTARFRACQIISEIIMRLPDDAEVSDDVWDEVIECMKLRVGDKVPIIRTFAIRSLSRFVNDSENSDILDLFLQLLPLEGNAEVRKTIVLALPPSNATSLAIINCTMDVSESVRKAAYYVLADKFPLQSLSIKQRTVILHRGLGDRSIAVSKECLKLMRDEWLFKCCNDDPIELLKYLDVETYESVGESVMAALLKDGLVKLCDGQSIHQYVSLAHAENEANSTASIHLMEPEFAIYWKTVCRHLQTEAQEKGSDAAATMGTEAAVYAAAASDSNDLLERILPATVSDYVDLVKAHIDAGSNYRFASRQLLLLGAMLDFSDSTSRKVASLFVQELLHKPLDHEVDDEGNRVVIGDGINIGGDKEWADAVSSLAKKVHAVTGEFEEIVLGIIEELARPCRERIADFMQWMHCLAVTGLLLENAKAMHWLQGKAIEPAELLQSLLLPGAKHIHLDVQRVAIRCLGLFGLLEKKPSEELVKQLRLSFAKGPAPISTMASKALVDICMWHGPQEVDKALGLDHASQVQENKMAFNPVNFSDPDDNLDVELLDLLYAGLDRSDWTKSGEGDENETVQGILGEGFAKILLLSENYASIPTPLHPLLLVKLIILYFSNETKDLERLKQCLSVFFEHYPCLSANHKKCLSKAFVPVMRSMWPGIYGNAGGSSSVVSNMRKRAVQASRFMLQMMQAPLFVRKTEIEDENGSMEFPETVDSSLQSSFECGDEGLAIRIAAEVAGFSGKKTPAERSYISALSRIVVLLHFRSSEQGAVKLMRRLLNRVAESVIADKDLMKELKRMAEHLKSLDRQPDEELLQDQINLILGRLELDLKLDIASSAAMPQTPALSRSSKLTRARRRVSREGETSSDDEETSPTTVVQTSVASRSQRASKTAALNKLTANRVVRIEECDDEVEEASEVTSGEDSDGSEQYGE
ncbi:condensin complex subunit 3 isoform X2 [Ricinus communis]|uniref:condensin complex subunit 3 isoform X2 n=1 Tax=Ricinus communis TaxID=3988 RepID=UPI00201B08CA|nr:condensin complex subunit 3 isoform X2 [Ricinus communis]